ncbi:adenosylcobinamide-phosphate synthase CbiB [Amaricoccus tamworthensis]|uniref:adenosylcobinamide-phosphate synthase CbiB n=1 Tax=Amaricoccus tamworthensis TaxID=57002 RepID=UPI003C7C1FB5
MSFAGMMLVALVVDAAFGWPDRVYRRIGHPVTWIGRMIGQLEAWLGAEDQDDAARFRAGTATAVIVIGVVVVVAVMVAATLPGGVLGMVIGGILAAPLVAARSLHDHVGDVEAPLSAGDVDGARQEVAKIVGRDPSRLDEAGIARAALESLAENTSDGVTAPLFWGLLFGLPGIAGYKAVNTLDSMIGYRNARYEWFGKFAARFDDVVNYVPARLTGLVFCLVSGRPGQAFAVMRRDAGAHRSPNAGWPEAAMAAGLGVRLSGPRVYGDRVSDEPWVNAGARDPEARDLAEGLGLYRRCVFAFGVVLAVLVLV